jgi:natural product precursor
MKKLNLKLDDFKERLTKQEMQKIIGGSTQWCSVVCYGYDPNYVYACCKDAIPPTCECVTSGTCDTGGVGQGSCVIFFGS